MPRKSVELHKLRGHQSFGKLDFPGNLQRSSGVPGGAWIRWFGDVSWARKGVMCLHKKTKNERMSTLKRALTIFRESSSEPNIYFCRWYIIIYFIFRELTYPLLFRHVWEDDFTVLRFGRICGLVSWRVSAKRNMNLKIEIALGCPWKLVTRE